MALVCHVDKADEMIARARENTPFCDFSICSFMLRVHVPTGAVGNFALSSIISMTLSADEADANDDSVSTCPVSMQ
jgi:hypothetical protein